MKEYGRGKSADTLGQSKRNVLRFGRSAVTRDIVRHKQTSLPQVEISIDSSSTGDDKRIQPATDRKRTEYELPTEPQKDRSQPPGEPPREGRSLEGAGEHPTPKKVVPVTLDAARVAIASYIESSQDPMKAHYDTTPNISARVVPEDLNSFLLQTSRGSSLFVVLSGYYPGPGLDKIFINQARYDSLLNVYEHWTPRKKKEITYERWKEELDKRLNDHEGPQIYYAFMAGMDVYSRAMDNSVQESGASIPPIPDSILDAYDRDLIDPGMAQGEKERRDELQAMFIHNLDQRKDDDSAIIFSPFGRFRFDNEVRDAIARAVIKRHQMGTFDENFAKAVTENPPIPKEHLPYFLIGAQVVHDVFALAHEIEEIRLIVGEPIDRQKESVTPGETIEEAPDKIEDGTSLDELLKDIEGE